MPGALTPEEDIARLPYRVSITGKNGQLGVALLVFSRMLQRLYVATNLRGKGRPLAWPNPTLVGGPGIALLRSSCGLALDEADLLQFALPSKYERVEILNRNPATAPGDTLPAIEVALDAVRTALWNGGYLAHAPHRLLRNELETPILEEEEEAAAVHNAPRLGNTRYRFVPQTIRAHHFTAVDLKEMTPEYLGVPGCRNPFVEAAIPPLGVHLEQIALARGAPAQVLLHYALYQAWALLDPGATPHTLPHSDAGSCLFSDERDAHVSVQLFHVLLLCDLEAEAEIHQGESSGTRLQSNVLCRLDGAHQSSVNQLSDEAHQLFVRWLHKVEGDTMRLQRRCRTGCCSFGLGQENRIATT
ncbi:hypothetical protein JCM10213v2_006598 [Rhodosporidiobolus nylandii]